MTCTTTSITARRRRRWIGMLLVLLTPIMAAAGARTVVGPERCGECHALEVEAWRVSSHQTGFNDLHRDEAAKAIADRLEIKRIKRAPECFTCHYTADPDSDIPKAIAGVSCESCHGPASDWIERHANYGSPSATRQTETAEHRRQRHQDSLAAGMNPPFELVRLVRRCYDCHTIREPALVDRGGHPLPSPLELVAATQGEVRHNFFYSDDKSNREATIERRRLLHVVGRALALESALYGVAQAKGPGAYADGMAKRAEDALANLDNIRRLVPHPALTAAIEACSKQALTPGNPEASTAAAVLAAAAAAEIAKSQLELKAIDGLLPPADGYRGPVP